MNKSNVSSEPKCAQCGITEKAHQDLYATPLGRLAFTFQPDQGPGIQGEVHLCRPCTHEVLTERILAAAKVSPDALAPTTWM